MLIPAGKKRLYVVFDPGVGSDLYEDNKIFDRALNKARYKYEHEGHWIAPVYLYEESLKRGIQLLTPDLYFAMKPRPEQAIFIRDNLSSHSFMRQLIAAGAHPAILMAYEHPLFACEFYFNLEKNTRDFDHVLMPKGAGPRVWKRAVFHPWVPPMPYEMGEEIISSFKNRKFLTIINGNTRIHFLRRLYVHFWNSIKPFPSLIDRELYVDRLKAIRFFSDNPEFDLYGYNWDKPVRYTHAYDAGIKKSWRGAPEDKLGILQKYKFCIVFENCIFDGWITEKIFDAFAAGCIPVYLGAPDITEYVPKNCFVDFRDFKNFEELDYFLKNMEEKTFDQYIANIKVFFASDMYYHWSREKFAKDMIGIFESYCR